ncbi:MAG: hypothetical protein QMD80_00410 [archaeon]|nr:hypothetical protein [archaeon]
MRLALFREKEETPAEALMALKGILEGAYRAFSNRKNAYELNLREEERIIKRLRRKEEMTEDDTKRELLRIDLSSHEKLGDEYLERYRVVSHTLAKIESSISLAELLKEDLKTKIVAEGINYKEKLLKVKNMLGERGVGETIDSIYETLKDLTEEIKEKLPVDFELVDLLEKEERIEEKEKA